jgi:ssDNA-binding Zn-finger/Zn-ribbon topoisomerase 1
LSLLRGSRNNADEVLQDLKCACGGYLDIKEGKFGPFFVCINCNIVSFKKGLDMNGYPLKKVEEL